MTSPDARIQELLDKQAITEALYRYARSMDRLDADLGRSVFWPEARADYHDMFQGTGHEFVAWVLETHLAFEVHSHRFSNILVEVDGDTARSETYGDILLRGRDENGALFDMRNLGRYVDRWERRDGEWRISDREYVHDLDQVGPATGNFPTVGTRDRSDPSYFGR